MQWVVDGRLHRFVMLGEWAFGERWRVQPPNTLRQHDECTISSRRCIGLHVRHITNPLRAVPFDAGTCRIPWLAIRVCAGAVVRDAAIRRP